MIGIDRSVTLVLLLVCTLVFASFFVGPLILDTGELPTLGTDGVANRIDRTQYYGDLALAPRAIYWFGDLNCHQNNTRSLTLNGNQMPMDARLFGLFGGGTIGLGLAAFLARPNLSLAATFFAPFPRRIRAAVFRLPPRYRIMYVLVLVGIMAAPMVIDGVTQTILGLRVSTNPLRIGSGLLFGISVAYLLGSFFNSALATDAEPGEAEMPGGPEP